MKIKKLLTAVLFTALVLALAACNSDSNTNTSGSNENKEGGHFVYVTASDAPTLDPHGMNDTASTHATTQIFERLTDYNEDGTVYGVLAEEFTPLDDTTWEFKLRQGVTFQDGTDFTADAVKMSLDRLLDPELASPKAVLLNMIEEVIVEDEFTVIIKTAGPFAPLPAHLAHNAGSIVAPSAIEEEKNGGKTVDENPIGTGPFLLDEWNRGSEIKLKRNENYWGNVPTIETMSFTVVPEQSTRMAMLESGEANVALVGSSDVTQMESIPGIELTHIRGTRMDYLGFNMNVEPFDNKLVRQAVSMAINKQDIIDGILEGHGIPAVGPLAPTVVGNYQGLTPLPYDVEEAKTLLEEAGYADGFTTTLFVREGNKELANIAVFIQSQLQQININVDIQSIEWGTLLEKTGAGEHDLVLLGWTTVTADADNGLYSLFHSANLGPSGNRSFYKNERVDELLDYARSETDQQKRNEAYKEVSEVLVDEVPMVYLQHPDFIYGTNGVESGLYIDFSGIPYFKNVKLN
ncbi:glutathione ABC transporter substrate-binding protein [Sutcliffiella sp. NC1]|uniref:glutathione ABC transporter substrate-binding protein n=1 Tax=Sutcliffiella sp. NC1 TaxID=3004096 RepID=UPI0022DE6278|nr:glutathione ABC transporter substrate-binding protein [Sutcliffiella sp. NC1]WBL15954.1 glutathione ABC transporter substrate-binding protein [Sutcliffiella sp. NC1]